MSYFLRRLPLSRLLLVCGLAVLIGVSATALALALGTGPTPPPKPLPEAVHDAFTAAPVEGVSARVQLTNHLLEGASLAGGSGGAGGGLASSPLVTGGSGRLWVAKDGRLRVELQSEGGDTEVLYDGHTLSLYDPSSNTLYRYTPPDGKDLSSSSDSGSGSGQPGWGSGSEPPTVAQIEEAIARLSKNAEVSGAIPTDVAGQAAYTVRVSPREGGSLIGGAELSWDAVHGTPLRAAVYPTHSDSPALELTTTEISYGPVAASVFEFTPPAGAKVEEVSPPKSGEGTGTAEHPSVTTHGQGITGVTVISGKAAAGDEASSKLPAGTQKVKIGDLQASELPTELGTLLSFERSGVRYLLLGAVSPAAVEEVAKGL
jgi:outer membrane lipoprotein-sorting protein